MTAPMHDAKTLAAERALVEQQLRDLAEELFGRAERTGRQSDGDAASVALTGADNIRTLCEGLAEAERGSAALQEEVGRLREALEPFAEIAELDIGEDEHDLDLFRPMATHNRGPLLRVGLFRRARSALARTAGGKDD